MPKNKACSREEEEGKEGGERMVKKRMVERGRGREVRKEEREGKKRL